MAIIQIPVTSSSWPYPSSLSFNYPKEWATEETGAFDASNMNGTWSNAAGNSIQQSIAGAMKRSLHEKQKGINNYEKVLFKNIPYRQVTFGWSLTARNAKEFELYKSTIDKMKIDSAPDNIGDGPFWHYPNTFALEISAGKNTIFKTPEMACTDIQIDWTPHGYWSQTGGNPTTIGLTMTFTELQLATKQNLSNKVII